MHCVVAATVSFTRREVGVVTVGVLWNRCCHKVAIGTLQAGEFVGPCYSRSKFGDVDVRIFVRRLQVRILLSLLGIVPHRMPFCAATNQNCVERTR